MLVALLVLGCRPPVTGPPPVAVPAAPREEVLWAERHDPAALSEAMDLYVQRLDADPGDRAALERLAQGAVLRAEGTAMPPDTFYDMAAAWSERCLQLNPAYAAARQKARVTEPAVAATLTVEDVPCAYWGGLALERWAALQGTSTAERHRARVQAQLTQVTRLSPAYFHAGPDRFWGRYYAALPDYAGRDLAASRAHFEQARQTAPGFLGTAVDMAEHWAVAAGNPAAFGDLLGEVLAADPAAPAALRAENEIARRRAQALQGRHAELFADRAASP